MHYVVKNFEKHQHYKDRRPPWIKLHRTLLDDCAFLRLHAASRALAPLLWLLASEENNGIVKGDAKEIAFRLRLDEKEVAEGIKGLISIDYISCYQDASSTLADCKQEARVETETETEAEKERETDIYPPAPTGELFASSDPTEKTPELHPTMKRLGALYNRRHTTPWSEKEKKSFKAASINEEDLALIEKYYKAYVVVDGKDFRRHDIVTLLNNWNGECDKARRYLGQVRSNIKLTHLPDTRTFTCPRCGKTGTLKDTISAQLGGYEDNEHLGQRCCGCYTDPYSGDFNFKIGKGKYPLAQIVELK